MLHCDVVATWSLAVSYAPVAMHTVFRMCESRLARPHRRIPARSPSHVAAAGTRRYPRTRTPRRVARVGVVVWRGGMLMLHAVAYDTRTERRSNRFAHFLRHTALLGTRGQSTHWTAWSSSVPTTPECATGGRTCCRALHRRALQSAQSRRVLRAAYSVAACCKLACCMLRAAKCALPVIRGMLHAAVCSSFSTLHAALAHWHYQYGE
jgi:hypothetical protein